MTQYQVLQNPDFKKKTLFLIQRDTSVTSLGEVLSKTVDGQEHPVFICQKLHHITVKIEGLVVKWAVWALQYYLSSNPFLLIINLVPLLWMGGMKDHIAHIMR